MVRSTDVRTIVAYRSQAERVAGFAETALIENGQRAYTRDDGRVNGISQHAALEALVNINSVTTTQPTVQNAAAGNGPGPQRSAPSQSKLTSPTDEVTLSAESLEVAKTESTGTLRAARIAQIKAEIEAGTYDTDAKLDAAVERMLEKLS